MTSPDETVVQTDLQISGVTLVNRGKVRDVYEVDGFMLIVATDRLSAFDVVLPSPIPNKGRVLTQLSKFWFDRMAADGIIANHLVATDVAEFPRVLAPASDLLRDRSMLCRKADVFQVECVARGYLIGSGWKDYLTTGGVCGIELPAGLRLGDKLPEPLFTPATKAERGEHDENISEERMAAIIGADPTEFLKVKTLEIYSRAAEFAAERGIIIADTKFEFGVVDDEIILVDECLTPDSSRFWPSETYSPGISPPSFDKQFVRDYLETLDWDKRPPAPPLPAEIVERTSKKYLEAYRLLTGSDLGHG